VRWFAQRAAPHHVTVNAVAPGPIDTGMTAGHGYDANAYPMKRMGQPEEIAGMLTYLCSPAAGFVSGAIMDVNGGTLMR
jgi:NAD(P)-dependent dehydrogenase (short-subunit alcohol dehydrogenase family)